MHTQVVQEIRYCRNRNHYLHYLHYQFYNSLRIYT